MHAQDLSGLRAFLPPDCLDTVLPTFRKHRIHLTITRERKTILGDYRPAANPQAAHRISVNGNLNPYSFLVTLLHEIAHLLTFETHGQRARPHGPEWKAAFGATLQPFLQAGVFPERIATALQQSITNPAASTCTDPVLFRALWHYDTREPNAVLVGDLAVGSRFKVASGDGYEVVGTGRTRVRCRQVTSGKLYLFPQVVEVFQLPTR